MSHNPTITNPPQKADNRQNIKWAVYILKCADNTLYTGISNNVTKRISTHNAGKGAKYTKARLPVYMVYCEIANDRSQASKREAQIKKLTKAQKQALISQQ